MKEFNPKWIKVIAAGLVIVVLGGYWIWRAASPKTPSVPETIPFSTVVDRGMSEEQVQVFRDKIVEFEAMVAEGEANGTRDVSVILSLGNLYYTIGELETASSWYEEILRTNPDDSPALENLGQALLEMGDFAGAEVSWKKAADIDGYEQTYIKLADLIEERFPERTAEVQTILEIAIANNGQTTGLLTRLARWYASQGMLDEAISHYQVAYQLDPGDQAVKSELDALRQRRSQEASEKLKK